MSPGVVEQLELAPSCVVCGNLCVPTNPHRPSPVPRKYCSRKCSFDVAVKRNLAKRQAAADKTPRVCARADCGNEFVPKRSDQKYCVRRCKNLVMNRKYEASVAEPKFERPCALDGCERTIPVTMFRNREYCSEECRVARNRELQVESRFGVGRDRRLELDAYYREKNREAIRQQQQRASYKRRAGGVDSHDIDRRVIFERDGWVCQLCRKPVEDRAWSGDPFDATIDHIVPLARGGVHEEANVQLAHLRCNQQKNARMPE